MIVHLQFPWGKLDVKRGLRSSKHPDYGGPPSYRLRSVYGMRKRMPTLRLVLVRPLAAIMAVGVVPKRRAML